MGQGRRAIRTAELLVHREVFYQRATDVVFAAIHGEASPDAVNNMAKRWEKLKQARNIKSNKHRHIGGRSF